MAGKLNKIKVDKIFKVCSDCGYKDGFHSMFERIEDSEHLYWRFICPRCHKIFDIGLKVSIES